MHETDEAKVGAGSSGPWRTRWNVNKEVVMLWCLHVFELTAVITDVLPDLHHPSADSTAHNRLLNCQDFRLISSKCSW
jgi:hypothetical protein